MYGWQEKMTVSVVTSDLVRKGASPTVEVGGSQVYQTQFLFFVVSETMSHVAQAGLRLTI